MNTEIEMNKWREFFETLSKRRFEWKTSIEVMGPDLGDQMLSDGLPFNGITMEKGETPAISISVGENPDAHQTHRISEPTNVAFLDADNSNGDIVEIEEKDGTKTLLTFIEAKGILIGFAEFEGVAAVF